MEISNQLTAEVTVLSNRFIDEYMRDANGEYVKVYLYFVRHEGEVVTIAQAALALDSTETDVRRAVEYWRKAGVFGSSRPGEETRGEAAAAGARGDVVTADARGAEAASAVNARGAEAPA